MLALVWKLTTPTRIFAWVSSSRFFRLFSISSAWFSAYALLDLSSTSTTSLTSCSPAEGRDSVTLEV